MSTAKKIQVPATVESDLWTDGFDLWARLEDGDLAVDLRPIGSSTVWTPVDLIEGVRVVDLEEEDRRAGWAPALKAGHLEWTIPITGNLEVFLENVRAKLWPLWVEGADHPALLVASWIDHKRRTLWDGQGQPAEPVEEVEGRIRILLEAAADHPSIRITLLQVAGEWARKHPQHYAPRKGLEVDLSKLQDPEPAPPGQEGTVA